MKFDKSKVITCVDADKAVIGKKYFFADSLNELKAAVEDDDIENYVFPLSDIDCDSYYFVASRKLNELTHNFFYDLLYPYEETNPERQKVIDNCNIVADYINDIPNAFDPCKICQHHKNGTPDKECIECCYYYPSEFILKKEV